MKWHMRKAKTLACHQTLSPENFRADAKSGIIFRKSENKDLGGIYPIINGVLNLDIFKSFALQFSNYFSVFIV